ncbi:MAG TPA: diguanylate cyclase, partial [Desulfosalsimonadaceae bacterium]|nr:diguanylate cyclase [Desulfosalsimonadaceae bacterium]
IIKSHPRFSDIPVVIMTAQTDPENIDSAFDAGAIEFLLKPVQKMELLARVRSIMHFKDQLDKLRKREKQLTEITKELETANARLERLSHSDGLTGIPNRRYFDYMFKKLLASATRLSIPIGLLMLDIDCFKSYNDTYGHLAGDDALKTVSESLHETIKRESDFIARYGGEEFAVVLFGTELAAVVNLGEKIRQRIADLNIAHQASTISDRVTVSIGVAACVPEPHITPDKLIFGADQALYQAKSEGRDRVVSCNPADLDKLAESKSHSRMARHYV